MIAIFAFVQMLHRNIVAEGGGAVWLSIAKGRSMSTARLIAASLLATVIVTPAHAEGPRQQAFTRDGVQYVFTSTTKGDRKIIEGRELTSGTPFRLIVQGRRVSGEANGAPVSFLIKQKPATTGQELAFSGSR